MRAGVGGSTGRTIKMSSPISKDQNMPQVGGQVSYNDDKIMMEV